MGMNYYYRTNNCKYCLRTDPDNEIHIGKASMGWTFSFHATPELRSYKDWIKFIKDSNGIIVNEEGGRVSFNSFKKLVKEKQLHEALNHGLLAKTNPERLGSAGVYDESYTDNEGYSMSPYTFS